MDDEFSGLYNQLRLLAWWAKGTRSVSQAINLLGFAEYRLYKHSYNEILDILREAIPRDYAEKAMQGRHYGGSVKKILMSTDKGKYAYLALGNNHRKGFGAGTLEQAINSLYEDLPDLYDALSGRQLPENTLTDFLVERIKHGKDCSYDTLNQEGGRNAWIANSVLTYSRQAGTSYYGEIVKLLNERPGFERLTTQHLTCDKLISKGRDDKPSSGNKQVGQIGELLVDFVLWASWRYDKEGACMGGRMREFLGGHLKEITNRRAAIATDRGHEADDRIKVGDQDLEALLEVKTSMSYHGSRIRKVLSDYRLGDRWRDGKVIDRLLCMLLAPGNVPSNIREEFENQGWQVMGSNGFQEVFSNAVKLIGSHDRNFFRKTPGPVATPDEYERVCQYVCMQQHEFQRPGFRVMRDWSKDLLRAAIALLQDDRRQRGMSEGLKPAYQADFNELVRKHCPSAPKTNPIIPGAIFLDTETYGVRHIYDPVWVIAMSYALDHRMVVDVRVARNPLEERGMLEGVIPLLESHSVIVESGNYFDRGVLRNRFHTYGLPYPYEEKHHSVTPYIRTLKMGNAKIATYGFKRLGITRAGDLSGRWAPEAAEKLWFGNITPDSMRIVLHAAKDVLPLYFAYGEEQQNK